MAVAIDASSAGITATSPTSPVTTTAFTVGAGSNRVLLVGITFDQTAGTVGSLAMHWDSTGTNQPMFSINTSGITSDKVQTWLFGLRAPTSGNKTLSITFTGAPTDYTLGIASFTGADQAADLTTFKNAIGSVTAADTNPYTATVNSPAGDMAIAYFGSSVSGWGVANTGTLFGASNANVSAAGIFLAGAGASTVLSLANGGPGSPACQVGCDIAAVAAGAKPFNQGNWPNPVPAESYPYRSFEWGANRKLLIGRDKLPFRQRDWPLPGNPEPDPRRSWEWDNRKTLAGQDALPFRQRDWPLPNPGFTDPDFRRSWTWAYNLNLIGKDQLPFRQRDWPVPATPEPDWRRAWTINLLQSTLTPIAVMPFRQIDWPVPIASEPDARRSWAWGYNLNLLGQDALPFRQRDWQLPQANPLIKTDQPPNLVLLAFTTFVMPFRQTDWPIPTAAEPDARRGWTSSYNLNLIGQDALPFRQRDWQLPVADSPWRMGPVLPNLTLILPPPIAPQTHTIWEKPFLSVIGSLMGQQGIPPS